MSFQGLALVTLSSMQALPASTPFHAEAIRELSPHGPITSLCVGAPSLLGTRHI